jgi:mono/diheme cytochrome c family protein
VTGLALICLLAAAAATPALAGPSGGHEPPAPAAAPHETPATRGARTYGRYCAVCHGPDGDGNGRAAALQNPRPANLRATNKDDAYLGLIVRRGGAALGRSPGMPSWATELSNDQVDDLVAFIRSINGRR